MVGAMDPIAPADSAQTLRITGALLAVWAAVTFGIAYFARDLQFHVLGAPFSFWVAAQGGMVVYVAIAWVHARAMRQLDRQAKAAEPEARTPNIV
jgi:putative solute:sodium symporter small subunit